MARGLYGQDLDLMYRQAMGQKGLPGNMMQQQGGGAEGPHGPGLTPQNGKPQLTPHVQAAGGQTGGTQGLNLAGLGAGIIGAGLAGGQSALGLGAGQTAGPQTGTVTQTLYPQGGQTQGQGSGSGSGGGQGGSQQTLDATVPGFKYDLYGDMLYQQYKDQYVNNGRLAMMDTMGQAAALTGGYGNSYASTAGNQAYQQYLSQLNNIVPQLEQRAYDRYKDDREYASSLALALLQKGKMPSAQLLMQAGISQADAQAFLSKPSGGGSSGGGQQKPPADGTTGDGATGGNPFAGLTGALGMTGSLIGGAAGGQTAAGTGGQVGAGAGNAYIQWLMQQGRK